MVECPICGKPVKEAAINRHIDSGCLSAVEVPPPNAPSSSAPQPQDASSQYEKGRENENQRQNGNHSDGTIEPEKNDGDLHPVSSFFQPASKKRVWATFRESADEPDLKTSANFNPPSPSATARSSAVATSPQPVASASSDHSPPPRKMRAKPTNPSQHSAPLAERARPQTLEAFIGHQDLVGPNGTLTHLAAANCVPSLVLWGGPGTGKTTIARALANSMKSRFVEINSANSGVADLKKLFADAQSARSLTGRKTVLFCDEIHRFSKSQQDVFLGPIEAGHITLFGATVENPSLRLQRALLSRCRVFVLKEHSRNDLVHIIERALALAGHTYAHNEIIDREMVDWMASRSHGDARAAVNLAEMLASLCDSRVVDKENVKKAIAHVVAYDRRGDKTPDLLSALQKSIRGSAPDATIYYLMRMLRGGEDPILIARRLIVIASEDVGLADNNILPLAVAAYEAVQKVGQPECELCLSHVAIAMAVAKKSTRAYRAQVKAAALLEEPGVASLPVPPHLRNVPAQVARQTGSGPEYKYPPEYRDGKCAQEYLPAAIRLAVLVEPNDLGTKTDPDLARESASRNGKQ